MSPMHNVFDRKRTFSKLAESEGIFLHRKPRSPRLSVSGDGSSGSQEKKNTSADDKRLCGLGFAADLPTLRNSEDGSSSACAAPSRTSSPKPESSHSRPTGGRRRSSLLSAMKSLGSSFRTADHATIESPRPTIPENPFDRELLSEEVILGSVNSHIPRVTSPIAPFSGFASQAEVVDNRSRYAERRRAARNSAAEKTRHIEQAEGDGLFFASRSRNASKVSKFPVSVPAP
ncbi:hypothetical protein FA95DRAFT_1556537 [Auriscalpium vulgare]|uniref:Uncharacterized protein n=1 Tax=Auriscalpium vulgare TaxID=40419 RepID=A0ACB8S1C4_9AGAM|nr:hypothetical protein FA95DRAFT_1556537 [Auriscalpium vulgare]